MKQGVQKPCRFFKDNRGAGLIMVLITMICVTLMGATLMYMSYIALKMKTTQQKSTAGFYNANEAMDKVRAGLQVVVSDALDKAYTEAIVHYNDPDYFAGYDDKTASDRFAERFVSELGSWANEAGYTLNSNAGEVIRAFLGSGARLENPGTIDFVPGRDAMGNTDYSYSTIKNICLVCEDSDGYFTRITTDIEITTPDFYYAFSESTVSNLPEFMIIAKAALSVGAGSDGAKIIGDAYVGEVKLGAGNGTLTHVDGTLICGGTIEIGGSDPVTDKFIQAPTAFGECELWAQKIVLDTRGAIKLAGTNYIADDLEFKGKGSKAVLSGSYFGFGSNSTDPAQSSSILVNSTDVTLDMSGLNSLALAGHGFIIGEDLGNANTLMGQSMATKRDQTIYLVPQHYFSNNGGIDGGVEMAPAGNPIIIKKDYQVRDFDKMTEEPVESGEKVLYYRLTDEAKAEMAAKKMDVKTLYSKPIPGFEDYRMVYLFLDFYGSNKERTENANAFFREYFSTHANAISGYLEDYNFALSNPAMDQTAGNIYRYNEETGTFELADSVTTVRDNQISAQYDRMKVALNQKPAKGTDADNPYDYYVLSPGENGAPFWPSAEAMYEFKYNDHTVGYLVNNSASPFVIDSVTRNARVIIAAGDVVVSANTLYDGLIICGGSIILENNATLQNTNVTAVSTALMTPYNGVPLGRYLRDGAIEAEEGEVSLGSSVWNYNEIISFKNWKKD